MIKTTRAIDQVANSAVFVEASFSAKSNTIRPDVMLGPLINVSNGLSIAIVDFRYVAFLEWSGTYATYGPLKNGNSGASEYLVSVRADVRPDRMPAYLLIPAIGRYSV